MGEIKGTTAFQKLLNVVGGNSNTQAAAIADQKSDAAIDLGIEAATAAYQALGLPSIPRILKALHAAD